MEKKILYNSPEAAQIKTVTGWVSSDGRFCGQDENMARYAGCTHINCECGGEAKKGWTKCDSCRAKASTARYEAYPFEEWDGVKPLVEYDCDTYFFSEDDIETFLEEGELKPEDLRLVIASPNYAHEITSEYWQDSLSEDGEIPEEFQKKLDELNEFIKTLAPLSYSPSKIRTKYERF